jgi:hypothetical protein
MAGFSHVLDITVRGARSQASTRPLCRHAAVILSETKTKKANPTAFALACMKGGENSSRLP